ncbi:hypothetical protein PM082_008293 [Marasmius tenuissimus]|nr:hypothetical protein PM082_008293 [Marasmius tenuissimus]
MEDAKMDVDNVDSGEDWVRLVSAPSEKPGYFPARVLLVEQEKSQTWVDRPTISENLFVNAADDDETYSPLKSRATSARPPV